MVTAPEQIRRRRTEDKTIGDFIAEAEEKVGKVGEQLVFCPVNN